MTLDERVAALVKKNKFTDRQARFLVTVMLHSGVCMIRQYCTFGGMVHGQTARDFFARLTRMQLATAFDCAHKRARLYHIHNRGLYEAIGEPHNRLRKPIALARAIEHLMVLDHVLEHRDVLWLATEQEKLAHFSVLLAHVLRRDEFPRLVFTGRGETTVRYFPDRLPIGVDSDRRSHTFIYLVTRKAPVDLRAFLRRHAELLRAVSAWTIRLLVPIHLAEAAEAHVAACHQELASPLRSLVVEEVRWYFEAEKRLSGGGSVASDEADRYARARRAFGAPRYSALYRAWTRSGESALTASMSPVLADAMRRGTGRIECQMLARPYLHLAPLAGTA